MNLPKNIKTDILGIREVKDYIKKLPEFHKLQPEYYAVEDGAADVVAKNVKKDMKVNQLRKFFNQIKRIELENKGKGENDNFKSIEKIYSLFPELAYALGRKLITQEFYDLMKVCLDSNKLKKIKDFNRLVDFLSAILAYHKMRTK